MEATSTDMEDKPGPVDSEEDENVEEDTEQDPKVLLGRKIYNYNKQVDAELFRLQLREGLNYEGALRVHYHNGIEENMRALRITNNTTVSELIPMLIDKFKPETRSSKDSLDYNSHYMVMVLDGVERELELHETPLQISLDSLKSPFPPRFTFKSSGFRTPASPVIPKRTSYQHYTDGGDFLNSSFNSKSKFKDYKQGSSPKHSRRSKSTSAATPMHTYSRSFDGTESPGFHQRSLKLKDRPISIMNSFVGNLSRSVKAKKKTRHSHSHTTIDTEESTVLSVKGLLSPIPAHKEFVEAKLLQVYGPSLGKGSIYKSVLISEVSTTIEVIKEALERYDISTGNVGEYCLCDVVGKYEDVATADDNRLSSSFNNSINEGGFNIYHMRVLRDSECPITVEQYWTPPVGYDRRFELRLIRDMYYTSPSCSSKRTSGDSENYLSDGSSVDDLDDMLMHQGMTTYRSSSQVESAESSKQVSSATLVSCRGEAKSSYYSDVSCPKEIPYLINLKPHLSGSGLLNPFGPGVLHVKLTTKNDSSKLNLNFSKELDLSTTHVFQLHCYRNIDGSYSAELFVENVSNLEITLNGFLVSQCRAYELSSGDIIEVGKQQHLFMYINPTTPSNDSTAYRWSVFSSTEQSVTSPSNEGTYSVVPASLYIPFATHHQDTLLNSVISNLDDRDTECKLLSAYVIASALHYATKHHSRELCVNVIQKTGDKIQQVIWNTAKHLSDWDPDVEIMEKAIPVMDKTLAMLQPVVYWIANTNELYHHIRRLSIRLDLQDQSIQEALTVLSNSIAYAFQQSFFPVGKIVYKTILAVLDDDLSSSSGGNRESCGWVMEMVVDLLQSILDLLNDHWVNNSIISQFYSNVFYFLDSSLLSSLMEMIKDQHFVASHSGPIVRAHLNMLEGWACGIGLKEEVMKNLAHLSATVDLLATEEAELVQMDWCSLREVFPMLNSAQLHYLLEHYKLSVSHPDHWTPSDGDEEEAYNLDLLSENFQDHPSFTIPSRNLYLNLIGEPPESNSYYSFISYMKTLLISYDAEENTVNQIDGALDQSSSNNTEFATPLHPRHRLLRRNSETESTGRVPSKEDVLLSSMNADLQPNLQTMSTGSHTESHEDMLQDSNFAGSDEEVSSINKDSRTDGADLTKQANRVSNSDKQTKRKTSTSHLVGSRSYVDSPVQFVNCATPDYSVQVVDVGKKMAAGLNDSYDEQTATRTSQDSTSSSSIKSFNATRDPRSHTVVIPRGQKDFGIFLVEGQHEEDGDPRPGIFVQSLASGSTAAECKKVSVGDQILAIDGQNLDGADYKIAFGYLKNAEDEVMLTVLPKDRLL